MITETIINFDAIMPYLICLAGFILLGIIIFLLHNLGGLKLFSNHDNKLVGQFVDKFPLVSPEFMKKSAKAQNIENNQEIQEINERLEHLEIYVKELNKKIENKLEIILKELNRG